MTRPPPRPTLFPYTTLFRSRPDVISMDIHMPVMDGLASVKEIMRVRPTPIVVVSGSVENSELTVAFNAIRSGADRKSTRLNSSHGYISYAVFCLKKKN